jgi:hypothetical protein
MGIGLQELLLLVLIGGIALSIVAGMVYATVLGVRRLFNRK